MWKKWNKTGKIKAVILGLLFLPNLFAPIEPLGQQEFAMVLMPLLFGSFAIPMVTIINAKIFRGVIAKPNWNDNPLKPKQPLVMFDFFAYFFLTVGLSMLIGTAITFKTLSDFGLTCVSFGLGTFIGIWLTLKLSKTKQ